jgi:hypothetical protein
MRHPSPGQQDRGGDRPPVANTSPRTSPIAQPVGQCSVAEIAVRLRL